MRGEKNETLQIPHCLVLVFTTFLHQTLRGFGVPPPSSRESLPSGWPERQGSPPTPGDEAALDKHRTYQRERVRHTIVISFHRDGPQCPCAMTSSSVMGPGRSWKPGHRPGSSIRTSGWSPDAPPSNGNWSSCPADPRRLLPGREPPPAQYKVPPHQCDSEYFCPPVASSAQMQRRVLRPSRLDDFWFGSLHSFHLVIVVVLLIALADVDHHARGGVGRRVQFILLPWPQLGDSI